MTQTIELIDLDTGAKLEAPADKVYNDKTSGLQFEGKPTERAKRAKNLLPKYQDQIDRLRARIGNGWDYFNGFSLMVELREKKTILEALELMAGEKK